MTTSYIKERVQELKAQKKLDRAKEEAERLAKENALAERKKLSDERIAMKQSAIDSGEVFVNTSKPVVEKTTSVVKETKKETKKTAKKAVKKAGTKVAPKKKGRPKSTKNKK